MTGGNHQRLSVLAAAIKSPEVKVMAAMKPDIKRIIQRLEIILLIVNFREVKVKDTL